MINKYINTMLKHTINLEYIFVCKTNIYDIYLVSLTEFIYIFVKNSIYIQEMKEFYKYYYRKINNRINFQFRNRFFVYYYKNIFKS